jgi:DNA excision repair protein ERCC-2
MNISPMKVSVRSLVEFILRSGDIDDRKQGGADPDSLQEGQRIHKMLQKRMPAGYRAEVTFRETFEKDGVSLTVEGRADGVWLRRHEKGYDGPRHVIDEIKSTYDNLTYYEKPRELHLAQGKCYAAMYMQELMDERPEEIAVQVTYCNVETEEVKRFLYVYRYEQLREWFEDLAERYMVWCRMNAEHIKARDESISKLEFPFPYRPGQRQLAADVYRVIQRERNLFIQAPTGAGKTLSTMYPAIRSMETGLTGKIFYLTAKTMTASVAVSTLELLESRGMDIKAVHITAKERSCINEAFSCNPDACPYADGHYDRVNDAVYDILVHEHVITRETIAAYAQKHRVCPYEYSLDISDWCDIIIGDYNYAFDPRVKLKRYFAEDEKTRDYVFLIDEAHNLVSRACNMYSASIVKEDVLQCVKDTRGMSKRLTSCLGRLNKLLLALKRSFEDRYRLLDEDEIEELASAMNILVLEISKLLEKQKYFDTRKDVLAFYFTVKTFVDTWYDDTSGYRCYAHLREDGSFEVKLLCIDPSKRLSACLDRCRSAVFFSATILPVNYYKELLTGNLEEYAVYAQTVFRQSQRLLLQAADVSSKYTRRNDQEYARIARYIIEAVCAREGNYMAFFPSYEFMNRVSDAVQELADERGAGLTMLIQEPGMSEADRTAFLMEYEKDRDGTLLGMCVLGGIFAEGIDLADEKLIGAIIVGTGLPMINPESEIARDYFNSCGKDGFAYAYLYPGMNKVMQAAGRVIRKETDRGVILLLDERFSYRQYRDIFPKEWSDCTRTRVEDLRSRVERFWSSAVSAPEINE